MKRAFPIVGAAWLAAAGAAALIHTRIVSIGSLEKFDLCLFHRLWGFQCPGCGMGHSILYAFQGQWRASFVSHPFGLVLLAVWTGWLACESWKRVRKIPLETPTGFELGPQALRLILGALLVGHVLR